MLVFREVVNPQLVSVPLVGPGTANDLFVLSGIALLDWKLANDRLNHDLGELDLSGIHAIGTQPRGERLFAAGATDVAAVAWPASMHGDDSAGQETWSVDRVIPKVDDRGRLRLQVFVALQGEDCALSSVAYRTYVRTTSVALKRISIVPNDVIIHDDPVPIAITLLLEANAPAGGQPVALATERGSLDLPLAVVPEGSADVTVTGQVLPFYGPGDTQQTVTATTSVNRLDFDNFVIHKV